MRAYRDLIGDLVPIVQSHVPEMFVALLELPQDSEVS